MAAHSKKVIDKVIHVLRETSGYLSGEELSRRLKISRTAIWKNIEELRDQGYQIDALPHHGYQLKKIPDRLWPREIQYGLSTKAFARRIKYYDRVTSTMDKAFELGLAGEKEGTLVCAESQTQGKGRLGRHWNSPKYKGLYMSLLLRPPVAPNEATHLTLLSAVAICEALQKISSLPLTIKWPNDILVNGRKIVGILTEINAEIDRIHFAVVGIGVNVNTPLHQLPEKATSLKEETQQSFLRVEVMQRILESLEHWYDRFLAADKAFIIERWKELSGILGRRIQVDGIKGEVMNLDQDGRLIVHQQGRGIVKVLSGDVELVS